MHLAPLAFAASVLLSVALVLAIAVGPQAAKRVEVKPHVVRVAVRRVLPAAHPPAAWLAAIATLRRDGRDEEADAEFRRFRDAYPDYRAVEPRIRP